MKQEKQKSVELVKELTEDELRETYGGDVIIYVDKFGNVYIGYT